MSELATVLVAFTKKGCFENALTLLCSKEYLSDKTARANLVEEIATQLDESKAKLVLDKEEEL